MAVVRVLMRHVIMCMAIGLAGSWQTFGQSFMGQSTSIQKLHDKRLESLNALLCLFGLARLVASGGSIDGIHASIYFTAFDTIVARSCPVAFESVYLVHFITYCHILRRQSGPDGPTFCACMVYMTAVGVPGRERCWMGALHH